jgi:two-component system response regulator DevR
MIRVAVVDDHHAIRLGVHTSLEGQPDLEPVGTASRAGEVAPLLYRTRPDVLIVDYRLPDEDGLLLGRRIKAYINPPRVVLHSAFVDDWLTIPALLAGIDGMVHKGAPGHDLAQAVRAVAAGAKVLPAVQPQYLSAASEALAPEDRPILHMLVDGATEADIARAVPLDHGALRPRVDRMLAALHVTVPPS